MDWAKYQERITIEDKDGKSFMEFIDVIGPIQIKQQMKERNMRQLGEAKKEKCKCDCGQDPCITCGKSHH
tara:strand:- start:266 stop:475 length:210 start_codon:yes stop_codon:yes gene_type:complete